MKKGQLEHIKENNRAKRPPTDQESSPGGHLTEDFYPRNISKLKY